MIGPLFKNGGLFTQELILMLQCFKLVTVLCLDMSPTTSAKEPAINITVTVYDSMKQRQDVYKIILTQSSFLSTILKQLQFSRH